MKTGIRSILACIVLLLMVSSCDKDEIEGTSPPEPKSFSLQWDRFIDNSAENTDIFIGTKYIGIQGWPLANPPYIYVGAIFPQNAFASSFDDLKEFMNKPFHKKDAYGYSIFCKGFYAKNNKVFAK
nr:hypothetical protein [uncultured Draconibacterium sp.]